MTQPGRCVCIAACLFARIAILVTAASSALAHHQRGIRRFAISSDKDRFQYSSNISWMSAGWLVFVIGGAV